MRRNSGAERTLAGARASKRGHAILVECGDLSPLSLLADLSGRGLVSLDSEQETQRQDRKDRDVALMGEDSKEPRQHRDDSPLCRKAPLRRAALLCDRTFCPRITRIDANFKKKKERYFGQRWVREEIARESRELTRIRSLGKEEMP